MIGLIADTILASDTWWDIYQGAFEKESVTPKDEMKEDTSLLSRLDTKPGAAPGTMLQP